MGELFLETRCICSIMSMSSCIVFGEWFDQLIKITSSTRRHGRCQVQRSGVDNMGWRVNKSTPLPTDWPSLVEIHGWSFIYADEIRKEITTVKYDGLAFGGHKKISDSIWCTYLKQNPEARRYAGLLQLTSFLTSYCSRLCQKIY